MVDKEFLVQNQSKLLDLFNSLSVGVYITDGEGNTLLVNDESCRTGGLSREEVTGKNMRELEESGFVKESITLKTLANRKAQSMLQDLGDGGVVYTSSHPVFRDEKIDLVITTERDVTEMENLRRLLKEKEQATEKFAEEIQYLIKSNMTLTGDLVAVDVESHIAEGVAKGAKILCGGKRATGFPTNLYFEPTVIDNVVPGMMLHDLETFGPVLPIIEFETDEEALAMANSTKLGLQMSVYTSSIKRAFWYQSRLVAGNVCINESAGFWEPHQPFGGCPGTETGNGRIGGKYTIEETTFLKTITVNFNKCL